MVIMIRRESVPHPDLQWGRQGVWVLDMLPGHGGAAPPSPSIAPTLANSLPHYSVPSSVLTRPPYLYPSDSSPPPSSAHSGTGWLVCKTRVAVKHCIVTVSNLNNHRRY